VSDASSDSSGGALRANGAEGVAFLRLLRPSGPWALTAIPADGGMTRTSTLAPEDADGCAQRIEERNRTENVYYHLNPTRGPLTKKAEKVDVRCVEFLHVDIDPRTGEPLDAEKARILALLTTNLPAGVPAPSFVIDSGNGYQALWRLREPIILASNDATEAEKLAACVEAERYTRALELKFGADATHNVDRVLRLPGTVNIPGARKRKKGRVASLARLVVSEPDRVYGLEQFEKAHPITADIRPASAQAAEPREVPPVKVDALEPLTITNLGKVVIAQGTDPDDPTRFKSRSEAVWFVACEFARAIIKASTDAERSLIESQAVGVLTDREWPISAHVHDQKSPERYARLQLRKALKETAKKAAAPAPEGSIVLADGRLNENLQAADTALLAAGVPIYERGGELVRPVRLERSEEAGGVRRDAGATVIVPVSDRWLVQRLADAAPFVRMNAKGDHVPADPPLEFARHLMDRQGEWAFPSLRGIVNAPTMRPDGSIVQTPGYDLASGLIFDPCGVEFPPIVEEPTREDALAALAQIDELFSLFPYERENGEEPLRTASYSVTLSALLCLVARDAMRTAPLHSNDSPTPGTGKTIQAESVAIIGTGSLPAMMSQGPSDEELEKRIATALRAGDRVIVIDNVERPLGGDFLCSVLTQERVQARILGKSERVVLPTSAVFIATGNNLQLAGDLARRAVKGRIDSGEERPDKREFPFDPRQLARQRRPQLVAAALTILRAYHVAGRPVKLSPMGSFEDYSLVRGAIVWLERADPARTREAIFTADPKRDELSDILREWREVFNGDAITLADAKSRLESSAELAGGPLYGLLVDVGARGTFNARAIGRRLAGSIDRPAAGLVLRRVSNGNNGARWRVEHVGKPEPEVRLPDFGPDAGEGFLSERGLRGI